MKPGHYTVTVKDDGRVTIENVDAGTIKVNVAEARDFKTALESLLPYWSDGDLVGNEHVVYRRDDGTWRDIFREPTICAGPFSDEQIDGALNDHKTIKVFNRKLSE